MQQRQFMLLPAITYKVKLCLHRVKNKKKRSDQHLAEVAKDIRSAIVPLMWVFDFPADLVYKLGPTIEKSSLAALLKAS